MNQTTTGPDREARSAEGHLRQLFYRGPRIETLHSEYAKQGRIDEAAPVQSAAEVTIDAPVDRVWSLLADLAGWERWAPGVHDVRLDGDLAVDTGFTWATGSLRIKSRLAVLTPGRELTWTGVALWTKAVDRHLLEPTADGGTRLRIEESLAGVLVPLFLGSAKLHAQHVAWLAAAKATAESNPA